WLSFIRKTALRTSTTNSRGVKSSLSRMTFHNGGRCVFGLTLMRGFSSVFWLTASLQHRPPAGHAILPPVPLPFHPISPLSPDGGFADGPSFEFQRDRSSLCFISPSRPRCRAPSLPLYRRSHAVLQRSAPSSSRFLWCRSLGFSGCGMIPATPSELPHTRNQPSGTCCRPCRCSWSCRRCCTTELDFG